MDSFAGALKLKNDLGMVVVGMVISLDALETPFATNPAWMFKINHYMIAWGLSR